MTLLQLVEALSTSVLLTVQDKQNQTLLKFFTKGDNRSLDSDFKDRIVNTIALISNSACIVTLEDETEPSF